MMTDDMCGEKLIFIQVSRNLMYPEFIFYLEQIELTFHVIFSIENIPFKFTHLIE